MTEIQHPNFVKFDFRLFVDVCRYLAEHHNPDDALYRTVADGLADKIDAITRHELYSQYKTASTEESRLAVREQYLKMVGLPARR